LGEVVAVVKQTLDMLNRQQACHLAVCKQAVQQSGRGAWASNPSSVRLKKDFSKNPDLKKYPRSARLGPEQWGLARIYSFLDQGKTFYTADQDIARKYVKGL
jgi:hypothetical protein